MPQLNKGGKFVFGLSVIRPDLTIHIPPQAWSMVQHEMGKLLSLQEAK